MPAVRFTCHSKTTWEKNWGRHATVLGYIPGPWVLGCILKGNMKRFVQPQCDWVPMAKVESSWDD